MSSNSELMQGIVIGDFPSIGGRADQNVNEHAAQCMNVALCGVRGVGVEPCLAQLCVCVNGRRLKGARAAVLLLS